VTLWLAFDIGTTGTKAVLIAPDGGIIASAYREYPTYTAEGGVVEQDANDWWRAVVETSREIASRPESRDIIGVALTGQMQDLILIDGQGNPLRGVILYSDTAAIQEAQEVNQLLGADRLRKATGNDQGADSLLAKLLWLARNEPDALNVQGARIFLGAADFVGYHLTGTVVTDSTTASTTGLMDLGSRSYHQSAAFDRLGLAPYVSLLPPIVSGGAKVGSLSREAAEALGLKAGLPVHHGPGDAGATTLGAGSGEPGQAYAYIGTSGWIAFTATGRADPERGAITLAHPSVGRYIQVAPLLTAGGNVDWVRDLFNSDAIEILIEDALSRPPTPLVYLPYLNGERSPIRDPLARGAFVGLSANTAKSDIYRAVLEGVVYAYRHALDALLPSPINALTLTGGGTRSRDWCQLFADILNIPVMVAADAENVGARGATLAAQVASGALKNYAPRHYFPVKMTLQPDSRYRQHYERQYRLYRELYPALRPVFGKMGEA
jgi:xylulokinase